MAKPVVTVLLGDPSLPDRSKPGGRFTDDDFDQVRRLKAALAQVDEYAFEYRDDHAHLLEQIQANPPEFILNFCDTGFRNRARHEPHVAALFEVLGLPHSGSGPTALGLCLDKALVNALARAAGVPVPEERLVMPEDRWPQFRFPAFVKPNRSDGSLGITGASIVRDASQARACLERLRRDLPGTEIIVQEFLAGREFGVGVIGNPGDRFTVLPVLEVDYSALPPTLPHLLDYGSKTDPASPYWTDVRFRAADLEPPIRERLAAWSRVLFLRLELRDYARFDYRADGRGVIKLLEVNPNPAWCWDGKLAHMSHLMGESHSDMLRRIIETARRRCFSGGQLAGEYVRPSPG